jgi:hypothetical protein
MLAWTRKIVSSSQNSRISAVAVVELPDGVMPGSGNRNELVLLEQQLGSAGAS